MKKKKPKLLLGLPLLAAAVAVLALFSPGATDAADLPDQKENLVRKQDGCRSVGPDSAPVHGIMQTPSFNSLVSASDAGVKGLVTGLSAPRWNSLDGKRWCFDEGNPDTPHAFETLYREATVLVEEVLFNSPKMPIKPKDVITVRIPGPGPAASKTDFAGYEMSNNELCCEFEAVGTSGLLLITRELVDTKEGPVEANTVTGQILGRWKLEGALAKSRLAERSVGSKDLVERVKQERSVGKRRESQEAAIDTTLNPLGGSARLIEERAKAKK